MVKPVEEPGASVIERRTKKPRQKRDEDASFLSDMPLLVVD